jgi:hypothetical protein
MERILIDIAERASQDQTLLAAYIQRYGEQEGIGWDEIAGQLGIDSIVLARIALCRRPRPSHFLEDTRRIAGYTSLDLNVLLKFLTPGARNTPKVKKRGIGERDMHTLKRSFAWAVGIVALITLVLVAFVYSQPDLSKATLIVSEGQATIKQASPYLRISNPGALQVSPGQVITLKAGDTISVGPGGAAQLRLYDGSSIDISENTEIQITTLDTNQDTYAVGVNLLSGKLLSRVLRLLDVGDSFEIKTPSSTVTVRGTVFTVAVISPQTTYVACEKGVVQVVTDGKITFVKAGEEVFSTSSQPPQIKPTQTAVQNNEQVEVQPTATSSFYFPIGNTATPRLNLATGATSPPPNAVATAEAGWTDPAFNQTGASTDNALPEGTVPSVSSDNTGNNPSGDMQVPGKPPDDVPGKPPSGGALPPGHGGSPPGLGGEQPPGHGGSPP